MTQERFPDFVARCIREDVGKSRIDRVLETRLMMLPDALAVELYVGDVRNALGAAREPAEVLARDETVITIDHRTGTITLVTPDGRSPSPMLNALVFSVLPEIVQHEDLVEAVRAADLAGDNMRSAIDRVTTRRSVVEAR